MIKLLLIKKLKNRRQKKNNKLRRKLK